VVEIAIGKLQNRQLGKRKELNEDWYLRKESLTTEWEKNNEN